MHNKSLKQYCFINKFNISQLSQINNDVGIIFRNYNNGKKLETIKKLKQYCRKYGKKLFLSNDIKLAIRLNLNGAYIPSFNKDFRHLNYQKRKDFIIIGSAHNKREINEKIKLFKIDAEGNEPEVLMGATSLLKNTEYISVDFGDERGIEQKTTIVDVNNFLTENNFNLIDFNLLHRDD